jgi:hypothetical protein
VLPRREGQSFLIEQRILAGSGAHQFSCTMGTLSSFPSVKAVVVWSWPFASIQCRNQCTYTAILVHVPHGKGLKSLWGGSIHLSRGGKFWQAAINKGLTSSFIKTGNLTSFRLVYWYTRFGGTFGLLLKGWTPHMKATLTSISHRHALTSYPGECSVRDEAPTETLKVSCLAVLYAAWNCGWF